ncbi:hypothetical protein CB1_000190008 [Camelus ferus]|nr:hypothetical protein CB1_000190008 [Camelus ferus]
MGASVLGGGVRTGAQESSHGSRKLRTSRFCLRVNRQPEAAATSGLTQIHEALPGLIWDLGQQLGDLSLESGGLEQESGRSSGFYEDPSSTGGPDSPPSTFCGDSGFSGSGSYGRLGPSEPRGIYASERPKSLAPQRRLLYGCAGSDSECSAGRLGPLGRRGPTGGVGGGYGESESSANMAPLLIHKVPPSMSLDP